MLPSDGSTVVGMNEIKTRKATQLQSVYAARQGKGLKVFVGADGTIEEYKAFTISDPPQIVFDLFNIKSPYDHEKVIPVNSEWVKQIRYTSESDKVRLILETQAAAPVRVQGGPGRERTADPGRHRRRSARHEAGRVGPGCACLQQMTPKRASGRTPRRRNSRRAINPPGSPRSISSAPGPGNPSWWWGQHGR